MTIHQLPLETGMADQAEYRYLANYYLEGTLSDARQVVPEVLKLIRPRSVIDLGCGIGAFLSVLRELVVTDAVGVDGHWVDRGSLKIPDLDLVSARSEEALHLGEDVRPRHLDRDGRASSRGGRPQRAV